MQTTVLVSPEDAYLLDQPGWHLNSQGYVSRSVKTAQGRYAELLHRLVACTPADMFTDHRNGRPWDCRRENLRPCTPMQNQRNRRMSKHNSTGYKGVYPRPSSFQARITVAKVRYTLGSFRLAVEAAEAYNNAARMMSGEFARGSDFDPDKVAPVDPARVVAFVVSDTVKEPPRRVPYVPNPNPEQS